RLLADLYGWLRVRRPLLARGLVAYAALLVALPLALSARGVLSPDRSAQQMAEYLDAHVPAAALVETWEPELGLLTDHRYHYPPIGLLDAAVRHTWLAGPPLIYNGLADRPPYVVVGSFGSWTGIYPVVALDRDYLETYRVGAYTLFRRK
ncbi:MAG: glycosyl transferase, partial [Chloroflexales bacterium]|nr:glycosyl transferase [Chloroflexales bacterium]